MDAFRKLLNTTENEETSANVSSILFRIQEHQRSKETNLDTPPDT